MANWEDAPPWPPSGENEGEGGLTPLDKLQLGLDGLGLLPVVGEWADGFNALVSLGRGDFGGAALSAGAMIPFLGWGATGAKVASKADEFLELPPNTIWRSGDPNPGNLTDPDGLSLRDSISDPLPPERPVFGKREFFGLDADRLPPGSVVYDNIPPGHVSVYDVPVQDLKDAVVYRDKFPR